jgi:ElaA protein
MEAINAHLKGKPSVMHAQAHLESWYTSLGWKRDGEGFIEAGIQHITMMRSA